MKKINQIILVILLSVLFIPKISASSISAFASKTTVTVGNSISVSVKGSDATGAVSIKSSNTSILSGGGNTWIENNTSSVKFTAKKEGTVTVTVTPVSLANKAGNEVKLGSKKITIKVVGKKSGSKAPTKNTSTSHTDSPKKETSSKEETQKSSINTLKSLSIMGHHITPKFDSNILEYKVSLDHDVDKITILAKASHDKAIVTGTGERKVNAGANTLKIVVRAENGSKQTYTIKAEVKDENPIVVKVDGKDYTIIRKADDMPTASDYYQLTHLEIDGQKVPAYYSDVTKYTLVALKDEEGKINLYIYDKEKNSFSLYSEIQFSRVSIYLKPYKTKEIPKEFKKSTLELNEDTFEVYRYQDSDYYLLYGMNVDTGEEGFYLYDLKEDTIQRYFDLEIKELKLTINKLYKIGFFMGASFIALLLSVVIVLMKKAR